MITSLTFQHSLSYVVQSILFDIGNNTANICKIEINLDSMLSWESFTIFWSQSAVSQLQNISTESINLWVTTDLEITVLSKPNKLSQSWKPNWGLCHRHMPGEFKDFPISDHTRLKLEYFATKPLPLPGPWESLQSQKALTSLFRGYVMSTSPPAQSFCFSWALGLQPRTAVCVPVLRPVCISWVNLGLKLLAGRSLDSHWDLLLQHPVLLITLQYSGTVPHHWKDRPTCTRVIPCFLPLRDQSFLLTLVNLFFSLCLFPWLLWKPIINYY